ncbi:PRC-barrel domain containing protein [Niveispirillum sp. SYP-B3756]|nr:PRC-barrel domain containing protein [Niveispirillum sp. SYP-B3756]
MDMAKTPFHEKNGQRNTTMRKQLIGAASAVALLWSGAAFAQAQTTGTESAPAADRTVTDPMGHDTKHDQKADGVRGTRASAEALMGRTVIGSDGKKLGEVKDVILDANSGSAKQVIISSGGFLGIGEKDIAVKFEDAKVLAGNEKVQVNNLTQAQVERLDGYKYDRDTVSLGRGGAQVTPNAGSAGQ